MLDSGFQIHQRINYRACGWQPTISVSQAALPWIPIWSTYTVESQGGLADRDCRLSAAIINPVMNLKSGIQHSMLQLGIIFLSVNSVKFSRKRGQKNYFNSQYCSNISRLAEWLKERYPATEVILPLSEAVLLEYVGEITFHRTKKNADGSDMFVSNSTIG